MAVEQQNWSLFKYVDDNAASYNMRGEKEAVRQAVDGSAAAGGFPAWGADSARKRRRRIIYTDPTTFRTKSVTFYTGAAYSAITVGTSTLTFMIPGSATGVAYTASKKIPEKQPSALAGPNLGEHA